MTAPSRTVFDLERLRRISASVRDDKAGITHGDAAWLLSLYEPDASRVYRIIAVPRDVAGVQLDTATLDAIASGIRDRGSVTVRGCRAAVQAVAVVGAGVEVVCTSDDARFPLAVAAAS